MTQEEKNAIIAKAEADKAEKEKANAVETEDEPLEGELTEEEKAAKSADEADDEPVDYEALAKEETERREKAEKALAGKAFNDREAKRKDKKDEPADGEDEDKPLTKRELMELLASERHATQKSLQESQALEIARKNTATEAEAQAAMTFYKNRVIPTGNLEDDVLFAIGGLNHKRTIAKNSELKRALLGKENASKSAATTHKESAPAGEAKMSPQDANAIKAAGMVWDGTKRVYKKALGNGKEFLFFDPKTKRRWKGKA